MRPQGPNFQGNMNQRPNRPGNMGPPPPGHPANMGPGPQGNPNFQNPQNPGHPGNMGPPPPGHPANRNPNFQGNRGPQNPNHPSNRGPQGNPGNMGPQPNFPDQNMRPMPNAGGFRFPGDGRGDPRDGFRPNDMRNPPDTLPGPGIFTGQVGEGRGASDWSLSNPAHPFNGPNGPHVMHQEAEDAPREAERSRRQVTAPTPWHKGGKN